MVGRQVLALVMGVRALHPQPFLAFPASWPRSDRRVQHGSRAAPSSRGLGHGPLKAETRVRIPLGPPPFSPRLPTLHGELCVLAEGTRKDRNAPKHPRNGSLG